MQSYNVLLPHGSLSNCLTFVLPHLDTFKLIIFIFGKSFRYFYASMFSLSDLRLADRRSFLKRVNLEKTMFFQCLKSRGF